MPGPLPERERRRRNAPTIPTRDLPAAGFPGPYPSPPRGVPLGKRGRAWWTWAWRTPQAAAWSRGDHYALARRAALEDDAEALEWVDEFDLVELLGIDDTREAIMRLEVMIRRLKALAGGRLAITREARELDDRFGLTPKGMAALRWVIVAAPEDAIGDTEPADEVAGRRAAREARGVGA